MSQCRVVHGTKYCRKVSYFLNVLSGYSAHRWVIFGMTLPGDRFILASMPVLGSQSAFFLLKNLCFTLPLMNSDDVLPLRRPRSISAFAVSYECLRFPLRASYFFSSRLRNLRVLLRVV